MKTRIDLEFLRTLIAVRLAVADRSIFRDLWQQRAQLLREQRRAQLVDFLTKGWDSYDLAGSADPMANRHDVPPTLSAHVLAERTDAES